MFRSRLDQIIDMGHPLVRLAGKVDWPFLESRFGEAHEDKPGRPPLPTRLMAGLAILKHMHDLSDESLCDRWIEKELTGGTRRRAGARPAQDSRIFLGRSGIFRLRRRLGAASFRAWERPLHPCRMMSKR